MSDEALDMLKAALKSLEAAAQACGLVDVIEAVKAVVVKPRGKPLKPFTGETVKISDEEIDDAIETWDERMPERAWGILEAEAATTEEEAEATLALET